MVRPAHCPAFFTKLDPTLAKIRNVGPVSFRELMLLVKADIALENQLPPRWPLE
jgi:hypothetical protein